MTDREQRIHDLALIIVENSLEDIDDSFGVRQYVEEAVRIYNEAIELIDKELD
jgi:hypothetical protein